jgi:GDP/UDP-N,N'-diacetylbacillosamine 2-epimerase (hydrolysing)
VKRTVCVVTGSRAEYGLLHWLMKEIAGRGDLALQVAATGMHLSAEFGNTVRAIEADGFAVDARVDMLLASDTPVAIAKSMGLGTIGFADAFDRLRPDIVVVLGDRFEILSAVQAALVARIPVAHLHGGETTEGAFDESIRHAITKMSHLHFTAAPRYRERVIQLGEDPARVFDFGPAAIDGLRRVALLDRPGLEASLAFRLGPRNLLVTFHPVTLEHASAGQQFEELLAALDGLADTHLIFTKPNADTDGRVIAERMDAYVQAHPATAAAFTSLGQLRYLSAMRQVDGVVGNSSSGIIEAPLMRVGTVNIGDRQKGRERVPSVIDCEPDRGAIRAAIDRLYAPEFQALLRSAADLQERAPVAPRIAEVLATYPLQDILKKRFHSVGAGDPR